MQTAPKIAGTFEILKEKIETKTAKVGIVGLGYVGLPLATEFAKAGFTVMGIDVLESKVAGLNRGESHVQDVPSEEVAKLIEEKRFSATTDFSVVRELDTINICVPTPLRKTKDPDMSYIVSAVRGDRQTFSSRAAGDAGIDHLSRHHRRTDAADVREARLKAGKDFFLCFSPERVDPGNPKYQTYNIPKVVGGITPACTEMGALFFSQALENVVPVSHARRRDGEAAGEHLPHDQHRAGERNGADVRSHGHQRLGSDRRGGDQALRLHAVLSRPGPRRALHSHRSVLSVVEDQAGGHRGALHRAGRLHQRQHAAFRGRQDSERAESSTASR